MANFRDSVVVRCESCLSAYAPCPGCGDRGDAAHISVCCAAKLSKERAAWMSEVQRVELMSRADEAYEVLGMVATQVQRRGNVELMTLLRAVRWRLGAR